MKFVYADGGRNKYFKAEHVGDCVTRAIANATGLDYKKVYDDLNRITKKKKQRGSSRSGIMMEVAKEYIENCLGWTWIPCMKIGTGCKVHVREDDLPNGRLILRLTRHFTCVENGALYDTYDCSRGGTRCVYGYWKKQEV